jgi:tetrahydromethanopterin S-methyltransferase subunit H
MYAAASLSLAWGANLALKSFMVCPRKQGKPVSSINDTKEIIASWYGLQQQQHCHCHKKLNRDICSMLYFPNI